MTPAQAFKDGGFNPTMKLWAREWYIVASVFSPPNLPPVRYEGKMLRGVRVLSAHDVASMHFLHMVAVHSEPDTAKSGDVISLLEHVFAEHGPPRKGVVISHSVWYSSLELLSDEDTVPRGQDLKDLEAEFGPMSWDAKKLIVDWIENHGLLCLFNADELGEAN